MSGQRPDLQCGKGEENRDLETAAKTENRDRLEDGNRGVIAYDIDEAMTDRRLRIPTKRSLYLNKLSIPMAVFRTNFGNASSCRARKRR